MHDLRIVGQVLKRLKRLPAKHSRQVWERINSLQENPRPQDYKKLRGIEGYRITVGEYRVLYTIDDQARVVTVYLLFHRGEGYTNR
jgi:mRNA interferase RelE/StbE